MKKENISDAVIRRLPRYYRQLTDLCARGVVRISSHSLGQEMNITASQISAASGSLASRAMDIMWRNCAPRSGTSWGWTTTTT